MHWRRAWSSCSGIHHCAAVHYAIALAFGPAFPKGTSADFSRDEALGTAPHVAAVRSRHRSRMFEERWERLPLGMWLRSSHDPFIYSTSIPDYSEWYFMSDRVDGALCSRSLLLDGEEHESGAKLLLEPFAAGEAENCWAEGNWRKCVGPRSRYPLTYSTATLMDKWYCSTFKRSSTLA